LFSALALTSACERSGILEVDGVRIHYEELGPRWGEPVVLIHGLYKDAEHNWLQSGIAERLAETHRVIWFDLRGHGRSDKPVDPDAYGVALANDVVALLDERGIERAHLVGFSLGGRVLLRLLVHEPERVRSAAMIGMGWERPRGPRRSRPGAAERALVESLPHLDISEAELAAISVPFEVWMGEDDPILHYQVAALREVRPDVPVHVIPGVGHSRILREDRFRDALAAYLNEGR